MCEFLIFSAKTNIGNIKENFVNKMSLFPSKKIHCANIPRCFNSFISIEYPLLF